MAFIPALVDMSRKSVRDAVTARLDMEEFGLAEVLQVDSANLNPDFAQLIRNDSLEQSENAVKAAAVTILSESRDLATAESSFLVNHVWSLDIVENEPGNPTPVVWSLESEFSKEFARIAKDQNELLNMAVDAVNELLKRAQYEMIIASMEVYRNIHSALFAPKSEFLLDKELVFRHMRGEEIPKEELLAAAQQRAQEAFAVLYSSCVWINAAALPKDMQVLMNAVNYQILKDAIKDSSATSSTEAIKATKLKGEKV